MIWKHIRIDFAKNYMVFQVYLGMNDRACAINRYIPGSFSPSMRTGYEAKIPQSYQALPSYAWKEAIQYQYLVMLV